MKTLILKEPGCFEYAETELKEALEPQEVRVKVYRVGICGTDYHAYRGQQPFFSYPRVLGHELGVEVVDVCSEVSKDLVGHRCSVEPYLNKRPDQAVRRGFTNCGENISVVGVHQDGGMREYLTLPARNLHPSSQLSYDELALVEPLAIGCHAVNRAAVQASDLVLVVGAGPIGLATARFAVATGARTLLMDINEDQMAVGASLVEVAGTVVASSENVLDQLRSHFGGDLPTVVLNATGSKESMGKALEYVASAGRVVFVGLFQGDFSFHDPYFHKKELTLLASRNALPTDFRQIITMMEAGEINVTPWITHRSSLEDMVRAFEGWLLPESGVIKALVSLR